MNINWKLEKKESVVLTVSLSTSCIGAGTGGHAQVHKRPSSMEVRDSAG